MITKEDDKNVKKSTVIALPVFLGARTLDGSDIEEFEHEFSSERRFIFYYPSIMDALNVNLKKHHGHRYFGDLVCVIETIKRIIDYADEGDKVVIFYIVTADVAESSYFDIFKKVLKKYTSNCFEYTIIVGGRFKRRIGIDHDSPYNMWEQIAHQLGAVSSFFNSDAPTAGIKRLVELMNRIMGTDLPGENIPDYSLKDLRQMAWHVNRENFNCRNVREGAIQKYNIVDGKPVFNVR